MLKQLKSPFIVIVLVVLALVAVACSDDDEDADASAAAAASSAPAASAPAVAAAPAAPKTIIQVGQAQGQAAAPAAPSGWDTEASVAMGVQLIMTFDSSGPDLWDAAQHPLVYFASEGPGYSGIVTDTVALPGYQAIDGKTHEILASPKYDFSDGTDGMSFQELQGAYFEPHGLGVSPDGQFIYIPTAEIEGSSRAGRLLIVNARTGLLHQILAVPSRPHHIKSFVDSQGNDRVLAYSWNTGAYILDPLDDNRVVGIVPNDMLMGRGYLAFVDPTGRYLFYTVRPPRGVEAQGTVAIIDTEDYSYIRNIGVEDPSPISVAFAADGKTAYVTGGHESIVAKIDMSSENPADWEMVKFARAGTEGPYGLTLTWEEDMIVVIGKGEGSHNKGITFGLVDPRMVGSARPLGEVYTGCIRADHGIVNPDPDANELWVSCNSSFETVIFDLSKRETRQGPAESDYIKARIPSPNGGSTHNGAFVSYNADWTGRVLSDQNGLHGEALATKLQMLATTAAAR